MKDASRFPDPTYKETVLAPLFEGVKAHYASHMAAINKAHLVMLSETGILARVDAAKIASALDAIDRRDLSDLTYTGEHEDYFFWVEAQLTAALGDLGGMLHTARSRNDMDHTVFKMALRVRAEALLSDILALSAALIDKADAEKATLIVAYTHGQPAQPSTFGHYLAAVVDVLVRDAARLAGALEALDHCPMGAAAITTTGFPIDRTRVAKLLGFNDPTRNSYASIAAVDYVTGLYSAMKLVFLHLGRVIQDLQFWTSFEVGQLYVPNALVQISSIMPQKRNPVPIEHMRHLASVTAGQCDAIVNTMHNTPFTDMNDSEGEVQQAGYAAFASGTRVLRLMTAFLPACDINKDRVQATTDAACITITELADTLVRDEGLSFRQAHEIAAATARAVIAAGQPLGEGYLAFATQFAETTGRPPVLDMAAFKTATSAANFIIRRNRHGGPAPTAVDAALMVYADQTNGLRLMLQTRARARAAAEEELAAAFSELKES